MGLTKASTTQRGANNYIFECQCGSHMLRICKDEPWESASGHVFSPCHTIEFWEYRGESQWNLWDRLKLAFRIAIGKEAKYPTSDIFINPEDINPLSDAIRALQEYKPVDKKESLKSLREKLSPNSSTK